MENTCNFDKCKFGQGFFAKEEECFNFKETWWRPLEGEPVLVKDCAPIRTMLMVQGLHDRLIGVQQSQEQQRNESSKIISVFNKIVLEAKNRMLNKMEIKELEPKLNNGD